MILFFDKNNGLYFMFSLVSRTDLRNRRTTGNWHWRLKLSNAITLPDVIVNLCHLWELVGQIEKDWSSVIAFILYFVINFLYCIILMLSLCFTGTSIGREIFLIFCFKFVEALKKQSPWLREFHVMHIKATYNK